MSTNLSTFHYLLIIFTFLCFPSSSLQQPCNTQDEASLLAFSAPLSTSSSFPPLNWSSSTTCCSWEGVGCGVDGRVFSLRLRSRGLQGVISSSISNLVSLTHLDLSNNAFSGPLPTGLFESLSRLETLDLSFNRLDGDFSSSLSSKGGLTTIRALNISNNNFHGVLESTMFLGASNLSSFNSSKNNFSGSIPPSICINSPLLNSLDFSYNSFNGAIPIDIGECSYLEVLFARYNSLSDPIPLEIGNLTALKELNLESNDLTGSIQSLMNCSNLVTLILRENKLEGDISTLNFSSLTRLEKLDLSQNALSGTLPESLYSCKAIIALRVATNNLTGQLSPKIAQLSSLSFLSLTRNSFTNITSTLQILAGCKNLTILFLGYNFKGETLPSDRTFLSSNGFQNLLFLSLLSCDFTGYFPQWISHMTNLRILHLSDNRITGTIPGWLGSDLPNLFALQLSNNLLSGEIPQELCLLPALVSANVSDLNNFTFDLPVFRVSPVTHTWVQYIEYRPEISLGNNRISGEISSEIGKLKNLHLLYVNGNNLSGGIPVEISELKNLEQLSLAENHLTGEIPASLGSLNFLSVFNVSYNDLEGPIPTGGQFDTFQASSYEGNPGLCGVVLNCPCKSGKNHHLEDDKAVGRRSFLHGLAVGIASGFSGVLAFVGCRFLYKNLYHHKRRAS